MSDNEGIDWELANEAKRITSDYPWRTYASQQVYLALCDRKRENFELRAELAALRARLAGRP